MRYVSSTLLAAQKEASAVPYVEVKASNRIAGVIRLRWERLYTGSETDAYHAVARPSDGSLLRARVDPSAAKLYYQRTASPDEQSNFAAWSDFGTVSNAGVALSSSGAKVLLAYVTGGNTIKVKDSSDNGATFGSAVTAATLASVAWLACALKSNGDALLVYANATAVYKVRRTSGSWGTPAAWPYSANGITGLALAYAGDFHLAIAGTDTSNNPRLWAAIYGDGFERAADTWSALMELADADSGSNVTFKAPFLSSLDVHRLYFVEKYTGTVAYSRPLWTWFPPSQSFTINAWREPAPLDLSSDYGTAMTGGGSWAWLSTPNGVWRAPFTASTTDLSGDVIEVSLEARRLGGRATVTLRNDDGRYNDLPGGAYSVIRPGGELEVSPGYVTGQGPEVAAPGYRYWIDSIEHTSSGGEATLVLHASDAWALIERWRARRQHTWLAGTKTIAQIIRFVVARAGIELLTAGTSNPANTLKPDFTISPGEDGLRAVRRLLAMVPDLMRMTDIYLYLTEPEDDEASGYDYGTDHPIFHARYASAVLPSNRMQVFGAGVVAQQFDWPDIDNQLDRLSQVFDLNATTQAKAEDRATFALRKETLAVPHGELVSPMSCGQEVNDVVAVTDPLAGLSAVDYRVMGVELRYVRRSRARHSPVYEQRLLLGAV